MQPLQTIDTVEEQYENEKRFSMFTSWTEPLPEMTDEQLQAWHEPPKVTQNPTRIDNPLLHWLVRTRRYASTTRERLKRPNVTIMYPMWCFDRFGMSSTEISRRSESETTKIILIGGEHEDSYDPDFYIYNDVTVISYDGDIAIYGYPENEFPPIDFHTVTTIGKYIYTIGCLGYLEQRIVGETPVYRLDTETMQIQKIVTYGDNPGWIFKHTAMPSVNPNSITVCYGEIYKGKPIGFVDNIDTWSLNLETCEWTRVTQKPWQQWSIKYKDDSIMDLFFKRMEADDFVAGRNKLDYTPDLEALDKLYRIDESQPRPEHHRDYGCYTVCIDSITVRITEKIYEVKVMVEGQLQDTRVQQLQQNMMQMISRISGGKECELITHTVM